jgi:alanine racemase
VGDSAEALELRAAGIGAPILILGTIIPEEVPQVVSHDLSVCVHSMDRIATLEEESRRQGRRTRVHLQVDTGMGRLGAAPARAMDLARAAASSQWLDLEGVASHGAAVRPGHPFTAVQLQRLDTLLLEMRAAGIDPPLVHFANTAAILGGQGLDRALVRPGISLYGMLGLDHDPDGMQFEPVMSLRTKVVYLKDVPEGTPVGYNGTHVTAVPTRIATLPVGYNDGLAYRLSNCGRALVRGALAPIVGAISMDYTTLDVGHIPGVSVGDTVTLIGRDGERCITIPELAGLVGTIPYEIACAVGKRVHRMYVRNERPAELST